MDRNEAIIWLKDFITRIDTQDNRATANPIQFLLQTKRTIYGKELSSPDEVKYDHARYDYYNYNSRDEIIAAMIENGWSKEDAEQERKNIYRYEGQHYWHTEQAFLTKQGVERHLEQNRHNLKSPQDYVVHAFRNPEMAELFEAIRAVVEFEDWKITSLTEAKDKMEHPEKYLKGEWPMAHEERIKDG